MAVSADEKARLESAMNAASAQVRKGLGMKQGGAAAEKAYGQAYQALVKAGLRQQLRGKYRY